LVEGFTEIVADNCANSCLSENNVRTPDWPDWPLAEKGEIVLSFPKTLIHKLLRIPVGDRRDSQ
jgi:hypothetical protein